MIKLFRPRKKQAEWERRAGELIACIQALPLHRQLSVFLKLIEAFNHLMIESARQQPFPQPVSPEQIN